MRDRPPNRVEIISETLVVDNIRIHVSYQLSEDFSKCVGVFFRAGKPGSPLDIILQDLGILLSLALQHGVSAQSLLASAQKLDDGKTPAGPLGTVLKVLVDQFQTP